MSNYPLTDDEYFLMSELKITSSTIVRVLSVFNDDRLTSLQVGLILYPNFSKAKASRCAKNLICKINRFGFFNIYVPRKSTVDVLCYSVNFVGLDFLKRADVNEFIF
jgi:hypothetical protein